MTSCGVSTRVRDGSSSPSKLSSSPIDLDSGVECGFDDGADDGIEPGRVAAAGQDANASDVGHAPDYSTRVFRR